MSPTAGPVASLTIVPNEPVAELLCGMLRNEGIRCAHRITDFAFGSGGELPQSGGGPRELLVGTADLQRARQILASFETDPGADA